MQIAALADFDVRRFDMRRSHACDGVIPLIGRGFEGHPLGPLVKARVVGMTLQRGRLRVDSTAILRFTDSSELSASPLLPALCGILLPPVPHSHFDQGCI